MNKKLLQEYFQKLNLTLNNEILKKLEKFKNLLQEYNSKFNLTSLITDDEIYLKHFLDCAFILTQEEIKKSNKILDIGTGAGFPGIVIGIFLENSNIYLLESNNKKCQFLQKVCEELDLKNIIIINERAEDYIKKNRETFDIVTSRAVANLIILCELSLPGVKINGYFMPMKANIHEELSLSKDKINKLGGKIIDIYEYTLPIEDAKRSILKIKKINKTNEIFPRIYNKIRKDLQNLQK